MFGTVAPNAEGDDEEEPTPAPVDEDNKDPTEPPRSIFAAAVDAWSAAGARGSVDTLICESITPVFVSKSEIVASEWPMAKYFPVVGEKVQTWPEWWVMFFCGGKVEKASPTPAPLLCAFLYESAPCTRITLNSLGFVA